MIDPFALPSAAISALAEDAERVARSDSPVLVLGETGVGKGVLARWLHDHGPRAEEAFVDLNCASLSRELLETELFGHEKGAFTGAVAAKEGPARGRASRHACSWTRSATWMPPCSRSC